MPEIGELTERDGGVIEWTISDFFSIPVKVDEWYFSPSFPFNDEQWYFSMLPNREKKERSEGYIEIYMVRESTGSPIQLNLSLGLKTSKNEIAEETYRIHNFEKKYHKCKWARFIKRSTLLERQSELAPSGHVTWVYRLKNPPSTDANIAIPTAKCAHCKGTVDAGSLPSHERIDKPIQCPECSDVVALKHWYAHECQPAKLKGEKIASGSAKKSTSKLIEDLKQLFENQENCDVLLRVKEREFQAHKNILTVRSPVLASIFRSDMKEKATGVVDIEDCDPSTFSAFLRFLYYEDVEGLCNENAFSLFTVADKYDVSDLREKCIEFMKENLSVDTFCDTFTMALRHSETELIRLATDFFVAHADKIIVTVEWQTFVAENPTQSNELFVKFVSSVKR